MKANAAYLPGLTALRGIAAVMVVVFHYKDQFPALNALLLDSSLFFARGYLWVDLFFLISGSVMMHCYGMDFTSSLSWRQLRGHYLSFLLKRFARIYPLHIFVLLVLFLCALCRHWLWELPLFVEPYFSQATFFSNVLMTHSLGFHQLLNWNWPSWSISAEWWAYVCFPLWATLMHRSAKWGGVLWFFGSWAVLFLLVRHYGHLNLTLQGGLLRCFAEFFIGGIVYTWMRPLLHSQINNALVLWLLLAVVVGLAWVPVGYGDVWVCALFCALLASCLLGGCWVARVLEHPVLVRLGDMSYSVYMLHIPLMFFIALALPDQYELAVLSKDWPHWMSVLVLLMLLMLLLVLSWGSYHCIERPMRHKLVSIFKAHVMRFWSH